MTETTTTRPDLNDGIMDTLMGLCENDDTAYGNNASKLAGDIEDAIGELSLKVDDIVADVMENTMKHVIQNLWNHRFIVDTDDSRFVSQEECAVRVEEAKVNGAHDMVKAIAHYVADMANTAIFTESKYSAVNDYYMALMAKAQRDVLLKVLDYLGEVSDKIIINKDTNGISGKLVRVMVDEVK